MPFQPIICDQSPKDFSSKPVFIHLINILILGIFCWIIYANTLDAPFQFDDRPNIYENETVQITKLNWKEILETAAFNDFNRPVARISFGLNYYFGKFHVTGYHIVNICIHMINGGLVYGLVFLILSIISNNKNQPIHHTADGSIVFPSLCAALIFIGHPVQIQAVTYIVQRMVSLAVMFYFSAFLLYLLGRLRPMGWRRILFWAAGLLCWLLALGSKQIAVTLPLIILLWEWYFFQDLGFSWIKKNILFIFIPIAVIVFLSTLYLGFNPLDRVLEGYSRRDFTMQQRLLTQPRVLIFYLSQILSPLPSRMNLVHDFQLSDSWFLPPTTIGAFLVLLGIFCFAIFRAKKQRLVSFCIFWFFVHLVIESSIIPLEIIFEHRLYLPMFGIVLLIGYGVGTWWQRRRWIVTACLALAVILLGTWTHMRNQTWRDNITFWADAVAKSPNLGRAHAEYGFALMEAGKTEPAFTHFLRSLVLTSEYDAVVHNHVGLILLGQNKDEAAISHFRAALKDQPNRPEGHNNLGVALNKIGKYGEAVKHLKKAVQFRPEEPLYHASLCYSYLMMGDASTALEEMERVKALDRSLGVELEKSLSNEMGK